MAPDATSAGGPGDASLPGANANGGSIESPAFEDGGSKVVPVPGPDDLAGPYAVPKTSSWVAGWLAGAAGSFEDAWLTTCASQIGQIMLTLPNAYAKVGLTAGLILSVGCGSFSLWTMYQLITLYIERKKRLEKKGVWFDDNGQRKIITQYHEVMGDLLGVWAKYTVQVVIIISLLGTNVSQIVASSSDVYYYNDSLSKRTWGLIFGGIAMLSVLLPTLRHFRIINIIALIGTTYTAWYIVATAASHGVAPGAASRGPLNIENFYVGASVLFSAFGGHAMALEIMDAMYKPEKYARAYFWSYLYIFSLTMPHSISVQLAYPTASLKNGNVLGVLPLNNYKRAAIVLMLMHQMVAFALYSGPLYYMWEKLIGTHHKPYWVRCPTRLPVALLVWVIALAFPFYGTMNAVIGALTSPAIAFIFPCLAYAWIYRTPAARAECPFPPPRWMVAAGGGTWAFVFALNALIVVFFLVNGVGFGIYYSMKAFVDDVKTFSVFAACYQCPAKVSLPHRLL